MTPALILLATVATFGVGGVSTSSLDYLVQLHEMSAGLRVTATATQGEPTTNLSLADFGIAELVCIHTPGHFGKRLTCEGTATQLPPLVPGAQAILFPVLVRAYVTVEGDTRLAVALDPDDARAAMVASQADAARREFERQLALATKCPSDGSDVELWRAGPAFLSLMHAPFEGVHFLTPAAVLEMSNFDLVQPRDSGGVSVFHPLIRAGDCIL